MFLRFLQDSKDFAGARTRFQRLITDLLGVATPGVSDVAGPGGSDWGIDTYVGELDGIVVVWQSKFFLDWGEDQHGQIRQSLNEIVKKSVESRIVV